MYDHQDRLTAHQAMAHPYFDPIREIRALSSSTSNMTTARTTFSTSSTSTVSDAFETSHPQPMTA